jgi:hypothetical protein
LGQLSKLDESSSFHLIQAAIPKDKAIATALRGKYFTVLGPLLTPHLKNICVIGPER